MSERREYDCLKGEFVEAPPQAPAGPTPGPGGAEVVRGLDRRGAPCLMFKRDGRLAVVVYGGDGEDHARSALADALEVLRARVAARAG